MPQIAINFQSANGNPGLRIDKATVKTEVLPKASISLRVVNANLQITLPTGKIVIYKVGGTFDYTVNGGSILTTATSILDAIYTAY